MVGLSGSGYGFTVKDNPLINTMTHGTHHPVDVRDIFDCPGHMEGGNTNNFSFIGNFMKIMMDELDTRN